MAKSYVNFDVPKNLAEKVYNTLEVIKESGKIRKGINEATKAIERGEAKLVVIAEDIEPEEIAMHLPVLCNEKKTPYIFVPSKEELGAAVGIEVQCASVVVADEGKAKKDFEEIITEVNKLNKK